MGMRLFAAIVPPPSVVAELDAFVEPRREASGPQLRWTRPESWHLTTAFMGDVAERDVDDLVENMSDAAARTPAFEVTVEGGGSFPHPAAAKHLWLGVTVGADDLGALARRTRTAAERAGVRVDGTGFTGHLTLARMNRGIEATKWLRVLDAAPPLTWRADTLLLIESHLHDRGNRYEVVDSFSLS